MLSKYIKLNDELLNYTKLLDLLSNKENIAEKITKSCLAEILGYSKIELLNRRPLNSPLTLSMYDQDNIYDPTYKSNTIATIKGIE